MIRTPTFALLLQAGLLSYAAPTVTAIAGCTVTGSTSQHAAGCQRNGGSRLTLTGSNFGASGAFVLVGSEVCDNVTHAPPPSAHEQLECTLPAGFGLKRSVLFSQSNGAVVSTSLLVSYAQCQVQ
jgi:hypothetical protein